MKSMKAVTSCNCEQGIRVLGITKNCLKEINQGTPNLSAFGLRIFQAAPPQVSKYSTMRSTYIHMIDFCDNVELLANNGN